MKFFNFQELEDLRNILKCSCTHISHAFGSLDALLHRDKVSPILLLTHCLLHLGETDLYLTLALVKGFKKEHFLLGQGLCLLLKVLLSQHEDVVLLLDDFLFIL